MKLVLAAGKRMVEREIDGLDAADEKVDDGEGDMDEDAQADASAIFGDVRPQLIGTVDHLLERMEKGVGKMVKGLDSA